MRILVLNGELSTKKVKTFIFVVPVIITLLVLPSFTPTAIASQPGPGSIELGRGLPIDGSSVNPSVAGVSVLCTVPDSAITTGIYPGDGGVFVENYFYGELYWCASGTATEIATAPPGGPYNGYLGMGGIKTTIGRSTELVLVLMDVNSYFWLCIGATSSGCRLQSAEVTLPSGFCSSMAMGDCDPDGVALDGKLNIYYASVGNRVVVECTYASAYQACTVLETLTNAPVGIFRDSGGNLWVSDLSCTGYVWRNGVVMASVGESLDAITISSDNPSKTTHVYVGLAPDGGPCFRMKAGVYDVTDREALPTPLDRHGWVIGLTTRLQFVSVESLSVYSTKDRK